MKGWLLVIVRYVSAPTADDVNTYSRAARIGRVQNAAHINNQPTLFPPHPIHAHTSHSRAPLESQVRRDVPGGVAPRVPGQRGRGAAPLAAGAPGHGAFGWLWLGFGSVGMGLVACVDGWLGLGGAHCERWMDGVGLWCADPFFPRLSMPQKSMRFGRIVNITSMAAKTGGVTAGTAYAASKGAISSLTFSIARCVVGSSVCVCARWMGRTSWW